MLTRVRRERERFRSLSFMIIGSFDPSAIDFSSTKNYDQIEMTIMTFLPDHWTWFQFDQLNLGHEH